MCEQLADILWVRCEGNPYYLDQLVKKLKAMQVTKVLGNGEVCLHTYGMSMVQSVASVVPDGVQVIPPILMLVVVKVVDKKEEEEEHQKNWSLNLRWIRVVVIAVDTEVERDSVARSLQHHY